MRVTNPEIIRSVTKEWKGDRDSNGRPLESRSPFHSLVTERIISGLVTLIFPFKHLVNRPSGYAIKNLTPNTSSFYICGAGVPSKLRILASINASLTSDIWVSESGRLGFLGTVPS